MRGHAPHHFDAGRSTAISASDILERLPYGAGTLNGDGVLVTLNSAGREMLGELADGFERQEVTCCDLFSCGSERGVGAGCVSVLALEADEPLAEQRVELASGQATVWLTAAPLACGDSRVVVFQMRPDEVGAPAGGAPERLLHIVSLGRTQVRNADGPLEGKWLTQRTGQLLKYLVVERQRVVFADEIAEALWPGREQGVLNNVRYFIHELRNRLEPERPKRVPSSFVLSEGGGYRLNLDLIDVDADRFERNIRAGRSAAAAERADEAKSLLEESVALYGADFLSDEPYAPWALNERERLRALAASALETLTDLAEATGEMSQATACLHQLAGLRPFDSDVERRVIERVLEEGRYSYARRRYAAFRNRMQREFGDSPDFELADLVRRPAGVDD